MSEPRPIEVELLTAPQNPLGTLYYVWKQSRHDKPLPPPAMIEEMMNVRGPETYHPDSYVSRCMEKLGFDWDQYKECAKHIRDEIEMILNESIPVTESLSFVFQLRNIPISLREQLVRHRIGVAIDPRVGADIVPNSPQDLINLNKALGVFPPDSLMEMKIIPDLAESSWWSQTSRVVPFGTFFDEGRYYIPPSLEGRRVQDTDYALFLLNMLSVVKESGNANNIKKVERWIDEAGADFEKDTFDAVGYYKQAMERLQHRYNVLLEAGVHIEDARQLVPLGATHNITWTINLKALLHIFGKRSSWIAQVGLWEKVMMQMAEELVNKVHPMFRMVIQPACIKKGKYVGCPVAGTNAERVAGVDGMPPCPLWVRYETGAAIAAAVETYESKFPGREEPAWEPPMNIHQEEYNEAESTDIRNWSPIREVEATMLETNAEKFSKLWGFDVFEGVPERNES